MTARHIPLPDGEREEPAADGLREGEGEDAAPRVFCALSRAPLALPSPRWGEGFRVI